MSTETHQTHGQGAPWRDESRVFRAVGVTVLLIFGSFVFYDTRTFYKEHLTRCQQAPDLPECQFLNIPRPASSPHLGIVLDHGAGKWAIQLEAMDQDNADTTLLKLTNAGASARLIRTTGRRKRILYNVQLGRFKTQKEATEAGRQLKARGLVTSFTVSSYRSASQ